MTVYKFVQWEDELGNVLATVPSIILNVIGDATLVARYEEVTAKAGFCFIATAAYGTSLAPQLSVLRKFRDRCLPNSIVNLYYRLSPPVADFIRKHAKTRSAVRAVIDLLVKALKQW